MSPLKHGENLLHFLDDRVLSMPFTSSLPNISYAYLHILYISYFISGQLVHLDGIHGIRELLFLEFPLYKKEFSIVL